MSRRALVDDDAAQYENIMRRLRRLEQGTPEDVHYIGGTGEPAFQNSWVNFDSGLANPSGAGRNAGFYRDRNRVYLLGLVKTGASGSVIFTLPVNYRPPQIAARFAVGANTDLAYVDVLADGTVKPTNTGSSNVSGYVYLEGISFRHA
jgi:hypothetical protein